MRRENLVKSKDGKNRWDHLMELDEADLNELLTTDLTEDERFDVVAVRILKEHMGAFIELAK